MGDSTTYGIGYYYEQGYTELCPSSQVWTPASGTLTLSQYNIATIVYPETGEELTITEAVTQAEPEYLYNITLGVNGVSFMDEEWFKRDYSALVESIRAASPDTEIVLNSIYPVAASYAHQDEISNEKIRAANGWIEQVATDTGCRFLYSYEVVVDESGNLPEERQNGDGIHLNGEAFTEVMYYIRTHADI
ncbi:MAG: GDSL-type esterase/lipase family protein [Oscillospiraceae bacterium]|nr:GDSL-type esterase/lipase family protein [Oscillospiraceae bacterium]